MTNLGSSTGAKKGIAKEFDKLETPYHSVLVGLTSFVEHPEINDDDDSAEDDNGTGEHEGSQLLSSVSDSIQSPILHANGTEDGMETDTLSDDGTDSDKSGLIARTTSTSVQAKYASVASSHPGQVDRHGEAVGSVNGGDDDSNTLEGEGDGIIDEAMQGKVVGGVGGPLRLRGGGGDGDDSGEDEEKEKEEGKAMPEAPVKITTPGPAVRQSKRSNEDTKPAVFRKRAKRAKNVPLVCECGQFNIRTRSSCVARLGS